MESLPPTIFVALGTFLAALITGAVTLVNIVISKEQKISELRQQWIDGLRNEVSEFIGISNSLYVGWATITLDKGPDPVRFMSENKELISKADTLGHRIKLRLNPSEHQKIIKAIDEIEASYSSRKGLESTKEAQINYKSLHEATHEVLKSEWERVKSGEAGYLLLKRVSVFTVVVTLLGTLWLYVSHYA